jgi:hypothetical protein
VARHAALDDRCGRIDSEGKGKGREGQLTVSLSTTQFCRTTANHQNRMEGLQLPAKCMQRPSQQQCAANSSLARGGPRHVLLKY